MHVLLCKQSFIQNGRGEPPFCDQKKVKVEQMTVIATFSKI